MSLVISNKLFKMSFLGSIALHIAVVAVILLSFKEKTQSQQEEMLDVSFISISNFVPDAANEKIIDAKQVEEKIVKEQIVEKKITEESSAVKTVSQSSHQNPASSASNNTVTSDSNTGNQPISGYEDLVLAKLERVKRYPNQALKRRIEGDVVLALRIANDGNVENFAINQSSGNSLLDKEALQMVERAAPFPSFANSKIHEYKIPIKFELS